MAYKVFTNGSVLNASEINDNLMNQSVMVFSNSTTRAAALTAPTEGMLTWLEDLNRYEYRSGAGTWLPLPLSSSILQVVQANSTATTGSSTTTYVDTGLSLAITPSSTSSKILVLVNHAIQKTAANAASSLNFRIFRGATQILERTRFLENNVAAAAYGGASLEILDSPNTTSSVTYKTMFANNITAAQVQVGVAGNPSYITLMEVAG